MTKIPYPNKETSTEDIEKFQIIAENSRNRILKLCKKIYIAKKIHASIKNIINIQKSIDRQIKKLMEYFYYGWLPNDDKTMSIYWINLCLEVKNKIELTIQYTIDDDIATSIQEYFHENWNELYTINLNLEKEELNVK